jgi:hypothetical protein
MTPRRIAGPALAFTSEEGQRTYTWRFPWPVFVPGPPREEFYSVTTLMDAGLPKFLMTHYAKMSSELAFFDLLVHDRRQARTMLREWAAAGRAWIREIQADGGLTSVDPPEKMTDEEAILRWLKGAAPRHRDFAADRGSAVHAAAEDQTLKAIGELIQNDMAPDGRLRIPTLPDYPDLIAPRMRSWQRWVNDFEPSFFYTEASVFSRMGYAGTSDAGVTIRALGRQWRLCLDYKSSEKALYPEVAIQTEAYKRADWIGLPDGTAEPMPAFDRAAALRLTDTAYDFRWLNQVDGVDVGDDIFRLFLNICEVGRFRLASPGNPRGLQARVIGPRIKPDSGAIEPDAETWANPEAWAPGAEWPTEKEF